MKNSHLLIVPVLFFALTTSNNLVAQIHEVISDVESERVLQAKEPMIVAFAAPWCGVCNSIKDQFNEVANDSEFESIQFVRIDTSKARATSKKYGIVGVPTFHYLKDGKKIHEMVGVRSVKEFAKYLKEDLRSTFDLATPAA